MPGQPSGVGERAAQQELDLGVGAAQLVTGPPGQGVMDRRVQPQQHALTLAHHATVPTVGVPAIGVAGPAITGKASQC
jgi:hypothetical protein